MNAKQQIENERYQEMVNRVEYCQCGHTGAKSMTQHKATVYGVPGHGKCEVDGCECEKFTWVGFEPPKNPKPYKFPR